MKTFKKFLSRSTDPNVAKTDAVFTVLALIWLAYVIAFIIALGGPVVLSKILPSDATESTKNYVNLMIVLITTAFFALFSWDMVNDKVRSAIKADVAVKELANSEKEYLKRQDLEFQSVTGVGIYEINPISNYELDKSFKARMARDTIIKGLEHNDDLFKRISIEATIEALDAYHISQAEVSQYNDIAVFRQDVFIYLKSWLMQSIMNGRYMNVSVVKQRYPDKEAAYVKALTHVRNILIKKRQVVEKLQPQYREDSIKMLEEYLDYLIKSLQDNLKN